MIRRPPRSTQSRSSAASDVYKRQGVGRYQMVTSKIGRSGTDRIRWGDRSDAGNGGESQHVDGVRPLLSTCSRSSEAVPGGIERALGTASRRPSGALAVTAASADPEDLSLIHI